MIDLLFSLFMIIMATVSLRLAKITNEKTDEYKDDERWTKIQEKASYWTNLYDSYIIMIVLGFIFVLFIFSSLNILISLRTALNLVLCTFFARGILNNLLIKKFDKLY